KCHGWLILQYDKFRQPYIQCSNYALITDHAHLLLHNLQEFDINYLHALLDNDHATFLRIEQSAKGLGLRPLAPCTFACSPCEQKQVCHKYTLLQHYCYGY
ncbi:hypothetical protein PAXRUDRAFT_172490, partial [Paxillus rubicundulus Ve08.2h10]